MMDIVIPYKQTSSHELRYALRSIEQNVEHDRLFIIGDRPKWAKNIEYINYTQLGGIYLNTANILKIACQSDQISSDFILTNDDIFILKKPYHYLYNRGTYETVLKNIYRTTHRRRMRETYELLKQMGYENPINYELHIPMIINKQKYLEATKKITHIYKYNKRSIYGNFVNYGGRTINDVKIASLTAKPKNQTFVSTREDSFEQGKVGAIIRETFNKRSRYEK